MSRIIKFRAWDTDNNQFVDCSNHTISQIGSNFGGLGNRYIYQQYTGLTDKNGVDIYEGDIIRFHYFYASLGENMGVTESEAELTGVVHFDDYGIAVEKISGKHWEGYTGYRKHEGGTYFLGLYELSESSVHEESFEVIGNIYENPDLIQ